MAANATTFGSFQQRKRGGGGGGAGEGDLLGFRDTSLLFKLKQFKKLYIKNTSS